MKVKSILHCIMTKKLILPLPQTDSKKISIGTVSFLRYVKQKPIKLCSFEAHVNFGVVFDVRPLKAQE